MTNTKQGRCLCGGVKVTVTISEPVFDACHCGMCRRWGGGPGLGVHATAGLKIDGEENVTTFDSSDWAQRAFCKRCGTHIFYRLKNGSFVNVPYGLLDDASDFRFTTQIYVDAKPKSYDFANETAMMTEAQVIAMFNAPPNGLRP